jgi:hypothetical protein
LKEWNNKRTEQSSVISKIARVLRIVANHLIANNLPIEAELAELMMKFELTRTAAAGTSNLQIVLETSQVYLGTQALHLPRLPWHSHPWRSVLPHKICP